MPTHSTISAGPRLAWGGCRRWRRVLLATSLACAGVSAAVVGAAVGASADPEPAVAGMVVEVLPVADASVDSRFPRDNFGATDSLVVDERPELHSLLRFDLSGYSDASVQSAALTFTTGHNASTGSQQVHAVADDTWTEPDLTWNNQPPFGSVIGSLGPTSRGTTYMVPLATQAVAGELGGSLSVALDSSTGDALWIQSRESGAPPALRLELGGSADGGGGATAPDTTITSAPPAETTGTTATLAFSASDPASTFECRLDAGSYSSCSSPQTYQDLELGVHAFEVRSTDSAGDVDLSPAVATWAVVSVPTGSGDLTLAAVGDINDSRNGSPISRAGLTASSILGSAVDAVAVLGDWQYEYGSCSALVDYFDNTGWGALMPKIIGAAGPTHDWSGPDDTGNYGDHLAGTCPGQTSGGSLSAAAWGSDVGPQTPHWVDLGAWRVFSVSSGLWRYDSAAAQATTSWLDTEIGGAVAAGDHPLVIWHEPYWASSSGTHSSTEGDYTRPWVDVLDKWEVPLLLSGHQHGYARFYPQTAEGIRDDATGIQQFVVGTGGKGLYPWTDQAANVATQQADTWGWLKLTLHPEGDYDWEFVPVTGGAFTDSGTR
jgi:acid phosphatase type 7